MFQQRPDFKHRQQEGEEEEEAALVERAGWGKSISSDTRLDSCGGIEELQEIRRHHN